VRFTVSATLDAIEARLALDPALARGVLDLAETVRLVDLDGDAGKPASLLRLGHLVDALGRHLAEDGVSVFAVAARSLLSDLDLSSTERMVVRRWADDGLVEVVPDGAGERTLEVAEQLGAPVLTRRGYPELTERYPWLPSGLLAPTPAGLSARGGPAPGAAAAPTLTRLWRCPQAGCASFGAPAGGQPPPRLRAAVPTCPRHAVRLADAGPRPAARVLAVRVDGAVRGRLVVREGAPADVGRAPRRGVGLGMWLSGEAMRWVSRSHLRLELRGDALVLTDTSTNGTTVRTPGGPVQLAGGQAYGLGADDVVELYEGVEVAGPAAFRGSSAPARSVMGEAPTVAIRLPR
jgi:hypothetical protein